MTLRAFASSTAFAALLNASGCGNCEATPSPSRAASRPAPVGTLPPLVDHIPGLPAFERKLGKHVLNHVEFRDGTARAIEQIQVEQVRQARDD